MYKFIKQYKGLPKEIYVISFAKIVNAMGFFVIPFMTLFLTRKVGMTEENVGKFLLIVSTTYVPGSIIGGKLTDTFGRKNIVFIASGFSALLFIMCGFLGNSMLIPWLLIIARFFTSVSEPAYTAMAMDLTNPNNRKESLSLLYLGTNLGVAIGPVIAGFLFENYTRWIFIGDGLTTVIAISLIFILVPETKPNKEDIDRINESDDRTLERSEDDTALSAFLKRPNLVLFCLFCTLLSFVYSQHSFTIPLQLSELFEVESSKIFGFISSANGIVVVISTPLLIYATKKLKPIECVALGGMLYSIGFGMLYFATGRLIFYISAITWTLGEVLQVTQMGVYIANHSPITHRGRFNSLFNIVRGTGYALGPFYIGKYLSRGNTISDVWKICFIMGIIACAALYILSISENKKIGHGKSQ